MEENLLYWNPWWKSDFSFEEIKNRTIFKETLDLFDRKEVLFLTGVRRSGKTNLMYFLINKLFLENVSSKNILYLNLDDDKLQKIDLNLIFEKYKAIFPEIKGKVYVFLDEIQNIENWERFVKNKYDSFEDIKFVITGSQSYLLKKNSYLLTGRILEYVVYPLSFKDFLIFNNFNINYSNKIEIISNVNKIKKLFMEYLEFGGFPEVVLEKDNRLKYLLLKEYFENIRDKDIIRYFSIKEIKKLENLIFQLISNISKPYSANKLGNSVNLSTQVVQNYFGYIELVFLFFGLNNFNYSVKNQIVSPKKIYSIDLGFINSVSFKFSENIGRLLENLVFIELIRREKEIYYHKDKHECDFVIKEGLNIVSAIQVTTSLSDLDTKKRELNGLIDACKKYKLKEGLILTLDEEFVEIGDKEIEIRVMSIWKWLLEN